MYSEFRGCFPRSRKARWVSVQFAAQRLSWAGRGESSAALGVSTDLGLQPNLKGHV